ncbi:MAG: hypothetical protein JXR03_18885 [Cyclobacteriaceae bacterium]
MNKKASQIAIGVLGVLLLVFFYLSTSNTNRYDWSSSFRASSKAPYGAYFIHELLKSKSNGNFVEIKQPLPSFLSDSASENGNYIFLGEEWFYSDEDIDALFGFAEQGSSIYIISRYEPTYIMEYAGVHATNFYNSWLDSTIDVTVKRPQLSDSSTSTFRYVVDWKSKEYEWLYADDFSDSSIYTLGYLNDERGNFFQMEYGEGKIYFHLEPILFSNFYLQDEDKLEYAEGVFAGLNDGPIYWDEFNHTPYESDYDGPGPLTFILKQPSLRWAWYLLLVMALLYLILYTKRRQRIIPVLPHRSNTSIEFVETIGDLYYQQKHNLKIIRHQLNLFLSYIRVRYGIPTNKIDEEFLRRAESKSGVSRIDIDYILKEAKRLEFITEISDEELIEYNKLTQSFYQKCK